MRNDQMTSPAGEKRRSTLAKLLLLGATLIWGSSFFIMKNTMTEIPLLWLLCIRFGTGAVVLAVIAHKKLRQLNAQYFVRGGIMGLLLFLAYVSQNFGLMETTPGKNAFLTTIYCILVPFLYWGISRVRPDRYNIGAAVICLSGLALVSLGDDLSVTRGDGLTLLGGIFFALHIVSVTWFSRGRDIFLLTMIQFAVAAIGGGLLGAMFEPFPTAISPDSIGSLLYLCFFATSAALLMQNVGQKYTTASAAALILSLESVFGVLFSILFYGERLSVRVGLGFALIFLAVVVSETKLSFLARRSSKAGTT